MNKCFSLTLIALLACTFVSCSKDDDNSTGNIPNSSRRLVKSITYDENDEVQQTIEWTYRDNYSCSITTNKSGSKVKVENYEGSNYSLSQQFDWKDGDWVMTYESKSILDASKRIVSNETRIGNPSSYQTHSTHTYSGDSTIIVSYRNSSEPTDKVVWVERGDERENISYTYLGDYQWKESGYEKIVTSYIDSKKNKPSSIITYNRIGEANRMDFEWSGESCKIYLTVSGVKYLHEEMITDGTTSTVINYDVNPSDMSNSYPVRKSVTKKIGNMTEQYQYHMVGEDWKLHSKDVSYYEEVKK